MKAETSNVYKQELNFATHRQTHLRVTQNTLQLSFSPFPYS